LDYVALGLASPEDLFDLETFESDPGPFYRFLKQMYPGSVEPSPSHEFLALLQKRKVLLRVYTQNIDGLEEKAGVLPEKVVPCHGSLSYANCMKCGFRMDAQAIQEEVLSGTVPICTRVNGKRKQPCPSDTSESIAVPPNSSKKARPSRKTTLTPRRSNSPTQDKMDQCGGVIKPAVVFFGEKLQDKVGKSLRADHDKADAIIVIGTSLSVAPMNKVIQYLPSNIPRILINKNIVHLPFHKHASHKDFRHGYSFDAYLLGNCDHVTNSLAKQMNLLQNYSHQTLLYPLKAPPSKENISITNRTFLFPGALYHAIDQPSTSHHPATPVAVHCNHCNLLITGTIMKCTDCFDFDLCMECFPLYSKHHFQGNHTFVAENH